MFKGDWGEAPRLHGPTEVWTTVEHWLPPSIEDSTITFGPVTAVDELQRQVIRPWSRMAELESTILNTQDRVGEIDADLDYIFHEMCVSHVEINHSLHA